MVETFPFHDWGPTGGEIRILLASCRSYVFNMPLFKSDYIMVYIHAFGPMFIRAIDS